MLRKENNQIRPAGVPQPVDRSLQGVQGSQTVQPAAEEVKGSNSSSGAVRSTDAIDSSGAGTGAGPSWAVQAKAGIVKPDVDTGTGIVKSKTDVAQSKPETAKSSSVSAGIDTSPDLIGYDNQINLLKKVQADYAKANETEEDRKKREKREKSKRVIAAVGDGIRALSNLYFTSQYAPNMYNPDNSQLDKVDARQDKLKAEREANRDRYLNYSLRIGELQNDRARTVREMEAQAERIRLAREKADREQEEHQWLSDLQTDKKREQTAKADAADSIAKTKKAEANNAPALQKAKVNTEQQRGRTEQTKQEANRASATDKRASAAAHNRSNVSEFSAYDSKGREHKFRTKDAAEAYAKQHGTFKEESKTERTTTTGKDKRGHNTSQTSTKTSSGGGYSQNPKKKFSSFSIHK